MGMKSYAQNFEDVYLERAFKKVQVGFYIDLGAYHPITDSVTKHFYDRGWSGINVEPGPMFHALVKARPRDTNLRVAVTNRSGAAKFYFHRDRPGTSTMQADLAPGLAGMVGERDISITNTMTLNELVAEYAAGRKIHFLKIDIEGNEEEVVLSTDWTAFKAEILVIESTLPMSNTRRDDRWNDFLAKSGYEFTFFDGINSYYVHREAAHLKEAFYAPVNALDYAEKQETRPEDFDDESLAAAGRAGAPSGGDDSMNLVKPASPDVLPGTDQALSANLAALVAASREDRDRVVEAVREAARAETESLRGDVSRLIEDRGERDGLRQRIAELESRIASEHSEKTELHRGIEERNAFIEARQIQLADAKQEIEALSAVGAERDHARAVIESLKGEIDLLVRQAGSLRDAETAARTDADAAREQTARVTSEWAEQFRQSCLLRDEAAALSEKLQAREAEAAAINDARDAAVEAAATAHLDRTAALREVEIVRRENAIFLDTMFQTERANSRLLEATIEQLQHELDALKSEAEGLRTQFTSEAARLQAEMEAQRTAHKRSFGALEAAKTDAETRLSAVQRELADSIENAERTRRESAFLMEAVLETPRREIETLSLALSQATDRADRLIPGLERDLSTANATIDCFADERADLVYDLRFSHGPRALKLVLPLARGIRRISRLGRKAPPRPKS